MIEWLPDSKNFVDAKGDVLPAEDYYDDIEQVTGPEQLTVGRVNQLLGQTALFELPSEAAIASSISQHPSNQNTAPDQQQTLADEIIERYRCAAEKKYPRLGRLSHGVVMEVVHNISSLSQSDLDKIALAIGYETGFFQANARKVQEETIVRELDWRERQYKDS